MLIRLARPSDLDALLKLSAMLPPGMTSMPFDKHTWEKKLQLVLESTQGDVRTDQESVYLLVLEEPDTGAIIGTAGIVAGVGLTHPFYNYKLSKDVKLSGELDIRVTSNLLNLVNDFTGETEMISLFLMPEHRIKYAGQFLSRCRYVFMSDFPERFSDTVFAEIRGWLDESEKSPFWQHLGSKFFNIPFAKADFISAVNGSQFISDLMPRFPVYLELLPDEAVAVIGKPHNDSVPAIKLLEREGFRYQRTIDIFDAGPVLQCERSNIESIRNTKSLKVARLDSNLTKEDESPICMVSNGRLTDYRLVLGACEFTETGELVMNVKDADALGVDVGSDVKLLQIR
ncbi:MAG: arginine N-succinyltransferase [Pseudohongiellaceae bacterium]